MAPTHEPFSRSGPKGNGLVFGRSREPSRAEGSAGSVLRICGLCGNVPQGTGTSTGGLWRSGVQGMAGLYLKGKEESTHVRPEETCRDSRERRLPTPPTFRLELSFDSVLGTSLPLAFLLHGGVEPVRHLPPIRAENAADSLTVPFRRQEAAPAS